MQSVDEIAVGRGSGGKSYDRLFGSPIRQRHGWMENKIRRQFCRIVPAEVVKIDVSKPAIRFPERVVEPKVCRNQPAQWGRQIRSETLRWQETERVIVGRFQIMP